MKNPATIVCKPCWQAAMKRADSDRYNLIKRLCEKFKNEKGIKTVELVRTKEKGHLTYRNPGTVDGELTHVEFISFVQGVAI